MATLTLKDIPNDVYELLAQSAAEHQQSIATEAVQCIVKVMSHQMHSQKLLDDLRRLRKNVPMLNAVSNSANSYYSDNQR